MTLSPLTRKMLLTTALITGGYAGAHALGEYFDPDESYVPKLARARGFTLELLPGDSPDQVPVPPAPPGDTRTAKVPLVSLDNHAGSVLVLHFWASWCKVCMEEMPRLDNLWQEARRAGIVMYGIASYDNRDDIRRSGRLGPGLFPILFDEKGKVALSWKVRQLPHTAIVDQDGRIAWRWEGRLDDQQMEEMREVLTRLMMRTREKSRARS